MYPSLSEFVRLSKEYGRIAVYKEIDGDMDTPVSLLAKLLSFETAVLLESARQDKTYSRFSFLAFDVAETLTVRPDGVYRNGERVCPPSDIGRFLIQQPVPVFECFGDFIGGYVGHLCFEFVGQCGILKTALKKQGPVLGSLFLVEKFCVYDNYTNKLFAARSCNVAKADPEDAYRAAARELDGMEERIKGLSPLQRSEDDRPAITRGIPRTLFIDKVERARAMIGEGEGIQFVLSDYLEARGIDPFDFYRNLRRINPSPYMYFLKDGAGCIVGSSPEVHLQVRGRTATLKPIAGTRGRASEDDVGAVIDDLLHDEKERAEHLMLVDLARNDLSRICCAGSVVVQTFMEPEVYSHVVHLVSEVTGRLPDGANVFDALMQTFPAGTVSGAPKVRAIEVIDEMEDRARGPYSGCVGYIGFNGSLDMAITIRTAVFEAGLARLQAGAGIVYDSVAEREYDEVMNKLLVLLKAGGLA